MAGGRRHQVLRVGVAMALATTLIAVALAGGQARAAATATEPTVGIPSIGPVGFGSVRPRTINYGGDPTSFVEHITWRSWGAARAVGQGTAYWVWPGWCVACASEKLRATVVAFDRSSCDGHAIYEHVEWYFPGRGMTFSPRLGPENLCTGHTPVIDIHVTKCGTVRLAGGDAAKQIEAIDGRCAATRRFVVGLDPGVDAHRSVKLVHDGWYCGSQVLKGSSFSVPQSFECERGDVQSIEFVLTSTS